jgi:hypothetical protein
MLINSILSNFFLNEEDTQNVNLSIEDVHPNFTLNTEHMIREIIDETRTLERILYPNKDYYLSEKMNFLMSRNFKNMSIKICDFIKKKIENNEYLAVQNLKMKSENIVKSIEVKSTENIVIEEPEQKDRNKDEEQGDKENKVNKESVKIIEEVQCESLPHKKTNIILSKKQEEDLKFNISMEINHKDGLKRNGSNVKNNTQSADLLLKNNTSRSFFGYYNFYNFFNHFVILYERLKFMKSLTNQNEGYTFMKKVLLLKLTNTIDSELFEDICSCLLSEYNGVFLNLDKILSNIIKEVPIHEIDQFVLESNTHLFYKDLRKSDSYIFDREVFPRTRTCANDDNQTMLLFLRTCHKLNSLTVKSKSNCKQSQIQSYINNNNLVNDHILKFEFRPNDKMFVIHKVKSIFKQSQKQVK